jgi:SpoVK/Ycf46/Vps4 family AAA+-type ATPase
VPGTGKTSLCRALAHKLAIRLSDRFNRATLLEIHSHSLFSKWFSTSGKLVSALFSMVRDMVEDDPHALVCVLIDEVESLASSRSNAGGGDPSDAMRAVNSLLTSLDRLRSFPNVLVLTTTNITGQIDAAFVDRVDLKIHIGLPILRARYEILRTCLEELIRVGIVVGPDNRNASEGMFAEFATLVEKEEEGERIDTDCNNDDDDDENIMLLNCARKAEGLSGRSLRRLPLQAHSQFLSPRSFGDNKVSTQFFLRALSLAIDKEQESCLKL